MENYEGGDYGGSGLEVMELDDSVYVDYDHFDYGEESGLQSTEQFEGMILRGCSYIALYRFSNIIRHLQWRRGCKQKPLTRQCWHYHKVSLAHNVSFWVRNAKSVT